MIQIIEKKDCCGCEACYNICPNNCILMEYDEEGFKFPIINKDTCINCNLCKTVCPILTKNIKINNESNNIIGYAAINLDINIREKSSSGGIFPLLAHEIINRNGIVVGVAMSNDCRVAQHIIIDNIKDLELLYGSKYLQSSIGKIYKKIKIELENNREVLFSGTPCQVAALHSYLRKEYDNLICIDLICHGVPSPKLWQKNVEHIEKKIHKMLKKVNFRYKEGNVNTEYGVLYQYTYYKSKEEDIFFRIFMSDLSLRLSCYSCKFKGISRLADITLGDFWGINDFITEMDDGNGVSIIVVRNKKGIELLNKIKPYIKIEKVDIKKVFQTHNEAMTRSSILPPNREQFWNDFQKLSFEKLGKIYAPLTLKEKIKSIFRKLGLLEKIRKIKNTRK